MSPNQPLDRLVIDAIQLIPPCTDMLATTATTASAAKRAASSAKAFQDNGDRDLVAARMRRCEKLLSALRDNHSDFSKRVTRLKQAIVLAAAQPAKRPGSWNRLSDQWWREKATRMQELLLDVRKRQDTVQDSWTLDGSTIQPSDSYGEVVDGISAAVDELRRSWKALVAYVQEWEETARVVQAGIGESRSLIPP